jgi:hypothetical protein
LQEIHLIIKIIIPVHREMQRQGTIVLLYTSKARSCPPEHNDIYMIVQDIV